MDTCFFCNKAIENEDEYILIGLVQDEVAELVPAHQDCGSDHVEVFSATAAHCGLTLTEQVICYPWCYPGSSCTYKVSGSTLHRLGLLGFSWWRMQPSETGLQV
jgi:hypothetical protein